jgi:23S rRNA pseudouridine2605 synthase
MAKKLEELTVYQKAVEFSEAVIALLDRPAFRKDRKLHDQISRYLAQSDYRDRGRFKLGPTNSELPENHTNQEPENPRNKGPRTQGPRTKGPRTKGPGTKDQGSEGPGTRGTGD